MRRSEEDDLEEAMRLSLVTYNREQQRNTNGRGADESYEHMFEDICSELNDETFDQEESKERQPRGFQQELIDTILKDHHNYIVFAPTGCGKTFIASKVAKHFLEKKENQGKKATVVFIVDRIPLVLQQGNAIKTDIGPKWDISQYCGDLGAIVNWQLTVRTTHVLVVIAQTLLNCIATNPGALADVDLLIFDECHHTTKDHPYHRIVKDHWKVLPVKNRPKIVGLTASPGGKPDKDKTKEKIHALCKNMHSKIIMVQENMKELKETLNPPQVKLINIILDPYLLELGARLTDLIKKMEISSKSPYKWPEKKTSLEYMRFCEQLRDKPSVSKNVRSTCALNLLLANSILLLEDVGLECVIDYLNAQQREGDWLKEIKTLKEQFMQRYRPGLAHGKRDTLLRILGDLQAQLGFKRGIVFVKTRASAHALLQTIQQHLKKFKPCLLVGHGAKSENGMKAKSQKSVVSDFNSGVCNLMIATSVAEEGLDIQACNTVIRYDALDTAEALIQSRGRARFHDSTFIVMLSGADKTKFHAALESEKNMHAVVSELLKKPGTFYDFLFQEGSSHPKRERSEFDGDDFGFHLLPSNSTSSNSTSSSNGPLAICNSPSDHGTDIVAKYSDIYGTVPQYVITATKRGFCGEASMDLMLEGFPHTIETEEFYEKSEAEVKLRLNEALVKQLFNLGELEKFLSTSPPPLPSPSPSPSRSSYLSSPSSSYLSSPSPSPSSASRLLALPYASSAYPGNPSALIPSQKSKPPPSPYASPYPSPSPSPSSSAPSSKHPVPTKPQLDRIDSKLNGKMPVSYLFEWCAKTKKSAPTKSCNDISPFVCTITIPQLITYKGPGCSSKKDAEHLAAKHVLFVLKIL